MAGLDAGSPDSPLVSAVLRMRHEPKYHDVTFLCNDGSIMSANRALVAARSEYLDILLFGPMRESVQAEVHLPSVSGPAMSIVLDHIHGIPLQYLSAVRAAASGASGTHHPAQTNSHSTTPAPSQSRRDNFPAVSSLSTRSTASRRISPAASAPSGLPRARSDASSSSSTPFGNDTLTGVGGSMSANGNQRSFQASSGAGTSASTLTNTYAGSSLTSPGASTSFPSQPSASHLACSSTPYLYGRGAPGSMHVVNPSWKQYNATADQAAAAAASSVWNDCSGMRAGSDLQSLVDAYSTAQCMCLSVLQAELMEVFECTLCYETVPQVLSLALAYSLDGLVMLALAKWRAVQAPLAAEFPLGMSQAAVVACASEACNGRWVTSSALLHAAHEWAHATLAASKLHRCGTSTNPTGDTNTVATMSSTSSTPAGPGNTCIGNSTTGTSGRGAGGCSIKCGGTDASASPAAHVHAAGNAVPSQPAGSHSTSSSCAVVSGTGSVQHAPMHASSSCPVLVATCSTSESMQVPSQVHAAVDGASGGSMHMHGSSSMQYASMSHSTAQHAAALPQQHCCLPSPARISMQDASMHADVSLLAHETIPPGSTLTAPGSNNKESHADGVDGGGGDGRSGADGVDDCGTGRSVPMTSTLPVTSSPQPGAGIEPGSNGASSSGSSSNSSSSSGVAWGAAGVCGGGRAHAGGPIRAGVSNVQGSYGGGGSGSGGAALAASGAELPSASEAAARTPSRIATHDDVPWGACVDALTKDGTRCWCQHTQQQQNETDGQQQGQSLTCQVNELDQLQQNDSTTMDLHATAVQSSDAAAMHAHAGQDADQQHADRDAAMRDLLVPVVAVLDLSAVTLDVLDSIVMKYKLLSDTQLAQVYRSQLRHALLSMPAADSGIVLDFTARGCSVSVSPSPYAAAGSVLLANSAAKHQAALARHPFTAGRHTITLKTLVYANYIWLGVVGQEQPQRSTQHDPQHGYPYPQYDQENRDHGMLGGANWPARPWGAHATADLTSHVAVDPIGSRGGASHASSNSQHYGGHQTQGHAMTHSMGGGIGGGGGGIGVMGRSASVHVDVNGARSHAAEPLRMPLTSEGPTHGARRPAGPPAHPLHGEDLSIWPGKSPHAWLYGSNDALVHAYRDHYESWLGHEGGWQGPGHVVVMTLDMHTHEAWFSVNGTKPRLGFRNLPNVAWPCISLQAPAVVEVWYGGG